jgi:hypothetical protein
MPAPQPKRKPIRAAATSAEREGDYSSCGAITRSVESACAIVAARLAVAGVPHWLRAYRRLGTTQPELSKILRGKFSEVSLERLMRFLTALGYYIEIKIGATKPKKTGNVTVKDARRKAA